MRLDIDQEQGKGNGRSHLNIIGNLNRKVGKVGNTKPWVSTALEKAGSLSGN
jgi:hypothetical protein